jgi:hypothetical protein
MTVVNFYLSIMQSFNLSIFIHLTIISHLYKFSTSSSLQSPVPGFIVAADPAAMPYLSESAKVIPLDKLNTIPPTMLSPAPTVLFLLTGGAGT